MDGADARDSLGNGEARGYEQDRVSIENSGQSRERSSAGGPIQKSTAWKRHDVSLNGSSLRAAEPQAQVSSDVRYYQRALWARIPQMD
jgi:hypothetical protein